MTLLSRWRHLDAVERVARLPTLAMRRLLSSFAATLRVEP
jgi:hypothetical protein